MKTVKLLKLELTNYRNIEHEVYEFGGTNSKIVGDNRIGKTNTLEAIHFLLTNYLLDGSNDLSALKPLADTKRVVSAKATFDVDGIVITIEKQYGENWVKKKGNEELVLDGHYEDYFFNGIKQTRAKDFYTKLGEHFGYRNDEKGEVDVAQMLCNPLYLGNLGDTDKWTMLRRYIISLIGDVTEEEVYQAQPATLVIKEDLEHALNDVEQVKKQYANEISGIKQTIAGYDANIGLLEKTSNPTDDEVANANKGIEEHQAKIVELQKDTGSSATVEQYKKLVADTKNDVLTLNMQELKAYQDNKGNPNADLDKDITDLNKQISDLTEEKMSAHDELREAQSNLEDAQRALNKWTTNRADLVTRLKEVRAKKKEPADVMTVCPTCGRPLEEEKVEEARKKIADELDQREKEIIAKGQETAKLIEESNKEIAKYQTAVELDTKVLADIDKKIATRKERVKELETKRVPTADFVESDKLKALRATLATYEKQLNDAMIDESKAHTLGLEQIAKEKEALAPYQKVLNDREHYERQMQSLNDIKAQKSECSKRLVAIEQKRENLNLFISTKLRLIDTHVAKVFGNIKFQLVKENLNGGFDQVCKPYIYDVDKDQSTTTTWKNGSKSEKIITGIAIVEAIKKELDLTELPYLFDEGGEISTDTFNTKFKTDAQLICVKVEDNILKPVVINF